FPKMTRNYDAFTLYAVKAFSDDWIAQASYTLSWLRGNVAGLFRPETGDLLPNYGGDFDSKRMMDNREGPLPGDHRHVIKLFGAKDWILGGPHRLGTGVALRAESGEPSSFLGTYPVWGRTGHTYLLPRGAGDRAPWDYAADLQLAYRYNIDKTKTISLT